MNLMASLKALWRSFSGIFLYDLRVRQLFGPARSLDPARLSGRVFIQKGGGLRGVSKSSVKGTWQNGHLVKGTLKRGTKQAAPANHPPDGKFTDKQPAEGVWRHTVHGRILQQRSKRTGRDHLSRWYPAHRCALRDRLRGFFCLHVRCLF